MLAMAASRVIKRKLKMLKKVVQSSLDPGENLQFYDLGSTLPAAEMWGATKSAIVNVSAESARRAQFGASYDAGRHYKEQLEEANPENAVLVTDRAVKIVPVKMGNTKYKIAEGIPTVVFPRAQASIRLGGTSTVTALGNTVTSVEVEFSAPGMQPLALHLFDIDEWSAIGNTT